MQGHHGEALSIPKGTVYAGTRDYGDPLGAKHLHGLIGWLFCVAGEKARRHSDGTNAAVS